MNAIMYVREVAERVRSLEGNITLFGKRNFTSFEGELYDLIFYSLPIKCPRSILKKDDLVIPMIPSSPSFGFPKKEVLKFDMDELRDRIFSYNSQSKKGSLLRFIQMKEFSGGFDIEKLCSAEINEGILEKHEYFDEIKYLKGDFNLNYTGLLNFPSVF